MTDVTEIELQLSGGAAETDPNLSLGGVVSGTRVSGRSATFASITGMDVIDIVNMPAGDDFTVFGNFAASPKRAAWLPDGGIKGIEVQFPTAGVYAMYTATGKAKDGYILVDITLSGAPSAKLPAVNEDETVTSTKLTQTVFDNISNAEAIAGEDNYRCLYFVNSGTESLAHVAVWITDGLSGSDVLYLGLDPAGIGDGVSTGVATTITPETAVPTGPVFTQPSEAAPLVQSGTIVTGEGFAFWLKREVPAGVAFTETEDTFSIGISAFVVL